MATIVLYGMTGCKLFWIKRIADMNYSTDQTQPNIRADPNYTLCLLSGFTRGLILKICIHSGFTLGPFRVQFEFTRGLLLGFNLNTEMRSRPIFYLTILLSVIPPPCIFQIHIMTCSLCFQGSTLLLIGVFYLCPLWVYFMFAQG